MRSSHSQKIKKIIMPQTSIILPCYNVENYLSRAIESVLNQTNPNFELLVVIDGSPDNSKKIAEEFAQKDNRIKVFEKENGGLSDARNYGLERASGEFIYFMDSDDWIEPNLLEDNLKIIENENLDFIIFGYIQDDENDHGKLVASHEVLPKIDKLVKGDPNISIDIHHIGLMGYAWNKVYRKSFLDEHNFRFIKGISLVEDILFNAPIYSISQKIVFNPKAYYHYFNRPVVTLMKTFHENSFELKKRKNLVLEQFFDEWEIKNSNQILAHLQIQGIRYCIHNLFSFKNQLNFKQKIKYIDQMYNDEMTRTYIKQYKANNKNAKLYKYLINNKMSLVTGLMAKMIK